MKERKRTKEEMIERATVFDGFGLDEQALKKRERLMAELAKNAEGEQFAEDENRRTRPVRKRSEADMRARSEASDWFGIGMDAEDAEDKIKKWKSEGLL